MSTVKFVVSPYAINNVELKNRVVLSPMTRMSAELDGRASAKMVRYYSKFAENGFGLIITEGVYTDELHSQGYSNQPGLVNESHVHSWKLVTDAVHAKGSKIIAQLMHAGALSQFANETVAPSAVKPMGEKLALFGGSGEFMVPRELSIDEIQLIIEGFSNAALNAQKAGFDGIEIHAANGYLLDQFLTDYTNERNDAYGTTSENRVRLIREVIKSIKKNVSENFIVGVRISLAKVNDFTHKWSNGAEDARVIFENIGAENPDYIHTTDYQALNPAFSESELTLSQLAKKYGKTTVIINGNLDQPDDAEKALAHGDLISLGKAALVNHNWIVKANSGEAINTFTGEIFIPDVTIKDQEIN